MNEQTNTDQIRSHPCPSCYLCGAQGELLYEGLHDRLFGAPGAWNFKRCPNPVCGLVWLDPMPYLEDISRAYTFYYTHEDEQADTRKRRAFIRSSLDHVYRFLLHATLIQRQRKQLSLMYLDKVRPGRVLDVGCGDGRRLSHLRFLGWDAQGQDPDPKAAARARSTYGLRVHLGPLEKATFPDCSFDAVILNHVIEHVHDPVRLLLECQRVLMAGGSLVAVTPNIEGCGHKLFRTCWRGLEPPRHVYLFSQKTLHELAAKAGFTRCKTWTTASNAASFAAGSLLVKTGGLNRNGSRTGLSTAILTAAYQFFMALTNLLNANLGDECVMQLAK